MSLVLAMWKSSHCNIAKQKSRVTLSGKMYHNSCLIMIKPKGSNCLFWLVLKIVAKKRVDRPKIVTIFFKYRKIFHMDSSDILCSMHSSITCT